MSRSPSKRVPASRDLPGQDRLLALVSAFRGLRIAVVADLVVDEFLNGLEDVFQ